MARPDFMLSVVVPLKDEEANVAALGERLREVLDGITARWEVILVDDGSADETYARALALHGSEARFKVVRLSRTFGHQVALSAGLDLAAGDAVVTMDGDLQHPPEVIPELVARWRAGAAVVYGVMVERQGESHLKDATARVFYRALTRLVDIEVPAAAGDFRLVDRAALDAFRSMRETNRYLRGMFSWVGFEQDGVPYSSPPRTAGRSKYTFGRMLRLATDAVVSFSDRPLRLALNLGFVVSAASILFGLSAVVSKLAGLDVVAGWTSVMILVGFVGGVQLIVLGIIGEYVGRISDEVKRRPLYVVRAAHGLGGPDEA
ncbi:MAG TPA: glycosyltransferase family 2 protein [Gaiella sp.]|jgi:dolichol-phosphate mannosyltransferase|nr:glycosyltransferase family 2 protein [Gaiella sp.]